MKPILAYSSSQLLFILGTINAVLVYCIVHSDGFLCVLFAFCLVLVVSLAAGLCAEIDERLE